MGALIDEIFLGIYNVNLLFEHKFKCKLFCESEAAQPYLNMATRSRINLAAVVATIGSIIDGICYKGVNALLGSHRNVDGSIKKIQKLLEISGIAYDTNTIKTLRTLHHLRSTSFPIHNAGPEVIRHLHELKISFPISNDRVAAVKMLQALNLSLIEMKNWFV